MKERFDLFFELKQAFSNGVCCMILWGMVLVLSVLLALGLYFKCYTLCSTLIELSVYILLLVIIATISWIHAQIQTKRYLKSLTTDEKDLLFYVYDRAKNIANAVYIPYDNAIAIDLKYKRILRRYETPIRVARYKDTSTRDKKFCYLYGIRKLPKKFIEMGKSHDTNLSCQKIRDELEIFQSIPLTLGS